MSTTAKTGTEIGTATGVGAGALCLAAMKDGVFVKHSNMILAKHSDSFISTAKKSFSESVATKLTEATKHIGNKDKFSKVAKSAIDLVDDANMKKKLMAQIDDLTKNLNKAIKIDKMKCFGGKIALVMGGVTACGALIGNLVGKAIDASKQKKELSEV